MRQALYNQRTTKDSPALGNTPHHSDFGFEDYNLGSSDEEATHWLLVDRQTHSLYVGTRGEVYQTLRGQYAGEDWDSAPQEVNTSEEITLEDFRSLIESFVKVEGPAPEAIIEAMRKQEALTTELSVWLDMNVSGESS